MNTTLIRSALFSLILFSGAALTLSACDDGTTENGDFGADLAVAHDLAGGDLAKNIDAGETD